MNIIAGILYSKSILQFSLKQNKIIKFYWNCYDKEKIIFTAYIKLKLQNFWKEQVAVKRKISARDMEQIFYNACYYWNIFGTLR